MLTNEIEPPFLGVLILDTSFTRPKGDAGNAESYECATRFQRVAGVGSDKIVQSSKPDVELIKKFQTSAQLLERQGARAIISTCGFLVSIQAEVSSATSIPVILSSLSLYSTIKAMIGGRPIAIMTASKAALSANTLASANIPFGDVSVKGFEDIRNFRENILESNTEFPLDIKEIEHRAVEKAHAILAEKPDTGAILLECGNLPPYAGAIEKATGLPVYSIMDASRFLMNNH